MEVIHKIGRRKTAVARVYVSEGKGNITVNSKDIKDYFPTATLQYKVNQPLALTDNIAPVINPYCQSPKKKIGIPTDKPNKIGTN